MKITEIELTYEDLVTILSDATYGNDYIEIKTLRSESYLDNGADFSCREERWAHRLISGGHIVVYDFNDLDEDDMPLRFPITLEDIKKGCITEDGVKRIAQYIAEENDMYSGYGIIQCAIYGEEIYG